MLVTTPRLIWPQLPGINILACHERLAQLVEQLAEPLEQPARSRRIRGVSARIVGPREARAPRRRSPGPSTRTVLAASAGIGV